MESNVLCFLCVTFSQLGWAACLLLIKKGNFFGKFSNKTMKHKCLSKVIFVYYGLTGSSKVSSKDTG